MGATTCALDSVVLEPTQVDVESDIPGRTSHPYRQVFCPHFPLHFLTLLALTSQVTVVLALLRSCLARVVTVTAFDDERWFAIQFVPMSRSPLLLHGALSAEWQSVRCCAAIYHKEVL